MQSREVRAACPRRERSTATTVRTGATGIRRVAITGTAAVATERVFETSLVSVGAVAVARLKTLPTCLVRLGALAVATLSTLPTWRVMVALVAVATDKSTNLTLVVA